MNQALYNDVWQQLLDAEKCYRYYNGLADRYRKRQKYPRGIMAASSVVGAVSVCARDLNELAVNELADLLYVPVYVPGLFIMFLAVFVAVAWDHVHDDGKKAAILYSISVECAELETESKELWRSVSMELPIDEVQVKSRLEEIERKLDRVTSRSAFYGIPVDEKLNEKSQEEGFKVISDRYGNREIQTT